MSTNQPFFGRRLITRLGGRKSQEIETTSTTTFSQWRDEVSASLPTFRRKKLATVLIADPELAIYTNLQKVFRRALVVYSGALAIGVLGEFFFPPLLIITALLLLEGSFRTFLIPAWRQFKKNRTIGTNLITGLTVVVAIFSGYIFFSSVIGLVAIAAAAMNVRVKGDTHTQLINVFKQQPVFVWVLVDGEEIQIPFRTLAAGDIVIVNTGNVVPADGIIIEGLASIDQQALTGESQPAEKEVGEEVLASTVVLSGRILIEVEKAGSDTTVAQIGGVLNKTIRNKSEVEFKVEKFVDSTVPPTLLASVLVFPIFGPPASLAILLAHFRRRPALYVSLTMLNYFRILSENSIFVKDGRSLDDLYEVDTVIFDKTGTLTKAQPQVGHVHSLTEDGEIDVLRYAAAAENHQHHPIALAILEHAEQEAVDVPEVEDMQYELGFGLAVNAEGHRVRVGSRRFMEREEIKIPDAMHYIEDQSHYNGHSLVMVALDDRLLGAIELVPTIRPEASAVIEQLRKMGVKETIVISGDHEEPTRKLANDLGIDRYYAEQLPQEKSAIIEALVEEGRVVCYIGDGINDAIALQAAQVSVSMSGASNVATDSAQIILTGGDLRDLPILFAYGQEYMRVSKTIVAVLITTGTIGMAGAVLPFAISFAFWTANLTIVGGFIMAMAPYALFRYRASRDQAMLPGYRLDDPMVIRGESEPVAEPALN